MIKTSIQSMNKNIRLHYSVQSELNVFRFIKKLNYSYCMIIPRILFKCTIKTHKALGNVQL